MAEKTPTELRFVITDGEWRCPHAHTHIDEAYGSHLVCNGKPEDTDYEDDAAEVCDQCGSYRWLEGDNNEEWNENEDSINHGNLTLSGGIKND